MTTNFLFFLVINDRLQLADVVTMHNKFLYGLSSSGWGKVSIATLT